jgi:hypothetical protein
MRYLDLVAGKTETDLPIIGVELGQGTPVRYYL